jgi:hypothetical protein
VVSSDLNKGGTWTGAIEQLDKLKLVPVYVRSTGDSSAGLDALRKKGALAWPNPRDVDSFEAVFNAAVPTSAGTPQPGLSLLSSDAAPNVASTLPVMTEDIPAHEGLKESALPAVSGEQSVAQPRKSLQSPKLMPGIRPEATSSECSPAEALFAVVREVTQHLLITPMKESEIAAALDVSNAQAKAWLQRLVEMGEVEKKVRPVRYVIKQGDDLFSQDRRA